MTESLAERLRRLARVARTEIDSRLDTDEALERLSTDARVPTPSTLAADPPDGRRRRFATLGAVAAVVVAVVGSVVLFDSPASIETVIPSDSAGPSSVPDTVAAAATTASGESVSTQPVSTQPVSTQPVSTTITTTVTSSVGTSPTAIPSGSFELASDDLLARRFDGDVYLYPGALGVTPGDPVLIIDRADPRDEYEEGFGPPIVVDEVAGTIDGTLVYSDCCEPGAGTILAITEPGAEVDFGTLASGGNERIRLLGSGHDVAIDPTGTRVIASSPVGVNLVDLQTGEQTFLDLESMETHARWLSNSTVVVLRELATGDAELARYRWEDSWITDTDSVVVPRSAGARQVDIAATTPGLITVSVVSDTGLALVDYDRATLELVDVDRAGPPSDASFVRWSQDGETTLWIRDGVAFIARGGGEATPWTSEIAEVWFPTIVNSTTADEPSVISERTDSIDAVEWQTLVWEGTTIERSCGDEFGCMQVAVGFDGSVVTYEQATRKLTKLSVPPVATTLPDTEDFAYIAAVGPDDVVYMGVASPTAELSVDVVAVAMGSTDAVREIGRWTGVTDQSGDSDLVPTRSGMVIVGCCGPDITRPAVDAPVVVPWLDRTGELIQSIRPSMRVEIDYPTLTVHREDRLPTGTHSWAVELGAEWQPRGMPQAMPTLDGGFIVATFGSRGTTITRGWIGGAIESMLLTDVFEITLDPSGRFIVPDGDRFARVDPFPDRTWILAERPEIDFDTGAVTVPGIEELAAAGNDWAFDPVAFADVVAGPPEVNEAYAIELARADDDTFVAIVTTSNLFDDSGFAVRYELTLTRDEFGRFRFESGTWAQACQPNRGHQDFSIEFCR